MLLFVLDSDGDEVQNFVLRIRLFVHFLTFHVGRVFYINYLALAIDRFLGPCYCLLAYSHLPMPCHGPSQCPAPCAGPSEATLAPLWAAPPAPSADGPVAPAHGAGHGPGHGMGLGKPE